MNPLQVPMMILPNGTIQPVPLNMYHQMQLYPNTQWQMPQMPQLPQNPQMSQMQNYSQMQKQRENENFEEIYQHAKRREKRKYKSKLEELKQQVTAANKEVEKVKAKVRPNTEKRTIQMQTNNCQDEEISNQKSFREDSFERTIEAKLEQIRDQAHSNVNTKKTGEYF